ncbi:MAG: Hemerythrin cation binding domain protein [Myxococcales bacterium]|nr:Hemerythrin cation binding domain protein [Myxococcales bacterium]
MRAAHRFDIMNRIADALELLTTQHAEIDSLVAEISTSSSPSVRDQGIRELAEKLTLHLALEQELFYPAVAGALSDEVHTELMAEHVEIKRVLADLLWLESEDTRFARKLVALTSLLAWHTTWQERELFETTAEAMTAAQLADLSAQIHDYLDVTSNVLANAA